MAKHASEDTYQPFLTITYGVVGFFVLVAVFTMTQVYAHIAPGLLTVQPQHLAQATLQKPTKLVRYWLTNFDKRRPSNWQDYGLGNVRFVNEMGPKGAVGCEIDGGTNERCGVKQNTNFVIDALHIGETHGLRVIVKNIGEKRYRNVKLNAYADWFENTGNGYQRIAQEPLGKFQVKIKDIRPGNKAVLFIPWSMIRLSDSRTFDPQRHFLSGFAVGDAPNGLPLRIESIQIYGPDDSNVEQGVVPAQESFYTLTNFNTQRPEQWRDYLYGARIEQIAAGSVCALHGGSYEHCGAQLTGRNSEYALRVSDFSGLRVFMKNTGSKVFENAKLYGYLDWHTQSGTAYVRTGIAPARDFTFIVPKLEPGVSTEVRIPWNVIAFEDGFVFDVRKDLLAGIAIGRSMNPELSLNIEQIQVYGPSDATIQYQREPHEGGYIVLKKASGAEYQFPKFDSAGRWGEPFAGYQTQYGNDVFLAAGDTISIHGIVPCGAIFRVNGTQEASVTIQGATLDATLDGTLAKQKCQAGREGDLLTLEGENFRVKNLRLRNTGMDFGYAENATAVNITNSKNVLIDSVEISNAGMGVRSSFDSENLIFQNSRVVGSGYPGAGHYHNIYLRGRNHTVENVFSAYALGGQDLKIRACGSTVHANIFAFAKNFEIDYPDDENPAGCIHNFFGNTVIPDPEPVNSGQIFTFFSDGATSQHAGALYATNNTFIDVEDEGRNTPLFRVGTPPEGKKILYLFNNVLEFRNLEYKSNINPDRQDGEIKGSHNFLLTGAQGAQALENSIFGTDPGLVRREFEFTPSEISTLRDTGNDTAEYLPTKQFGLPRASERPTNGVIDIGAREYIAEQAACTEFWVCNTWNACQRNGTQQRICIDRNNCGTTQWKPLEQTSCVFACTPRWECTPWGVCGRNGIQERTCRDVNECGDPSEMPSLIQSCTPACQGSVRIQNTPEINTNVIQSRFNATYPDFGYHARDNRVDQNNFYNVQFPSVVSSIPQDSQVTSARFILNFYQQYASETLKFFPFLESWGADGNGHASMRLREGAYDAYNRIASTLPQQAWQQFGGTIGNIVLQTLVENPERLGVIEKRFDITSLVRDWDEERSENFGIQLRAAGTQGFQNIFGTTKFDN